MQKSLDGIVIRAVTGVGSMTEESRTEGVARFRNGKTRVLVCTRVVGKESRIGYSVLCSAELT